MRSHGGTAGLTLPGCWGIALLAAMLTTVVPPANADMASDDPVRACDRAAMKAEAQWDLPPGLLAAIATVESGRGGTGSARPVAWPWSVNAGGRGLFAQGKAAAVMIVRTLRESGQRNIDVGCFQVNLFYHPDAFVSLDDAFDPDMNAKAAARILTQSRTAGGGWDNSIALYHSATPVLGAHYLSQVQSVWPWARARSAMSADIGPDAYAVLLSPAARQVRVISGSETNRSDEDNLPRVIEWPGSATPPGEMPDPALPMPRVVEWRATGSPPPGRFEAKSPRVAKSAATPHPAMLARVPDLRTR
jgi:hypothetical protein